MDSPETFKNTVTTTASTSTAIATSLSESPPVQESTFSRFVNNLPPIRPAKASHLAQGFFGLNSPPLVFTSPRISSQCETHFLKRPQLSQFETSQGGNGGDSFIDDPDNSKKPAFLLPGKVMTDTQKDLVIRNTQHRSSSPCVNEYLVDPSVNTDVTQSNEILESSLSDLTCSKEIMSKFHGPSYHYEGVDEPYKLEGEKTNVGSLSKECAKSEKQQCDNSFPQLMQAGLRHRGMHRRCLQFEVAASNAFGNINNSPLPLHTLEDSRAWATFSELKDLDVTSIKKKMVQYPEFFTSLIPPRFSGNFPVTGSKSSGIGLHLNSTVDAMPLGHAAFTGMGLAETYRQEKKSASSFCHKVENMNRCLISSNMDGQSSVGIEDERREITASIVSVSATPLSASTMDPSNLLDHVEHTAGVQNKRKPSPKEAGNAEEINQPSPKNKKTKISVASDGGGCKRCNCKKSKCLKLYCDCFAAGMYCDETCSCQDCYNRLEYEDTVLETKQQIESRNPLAFTPKIVQRATDFPLNNMEDDNATTPSSSRHKRGCNCKRSMCLKKYCECYQANVGCSSACRCEGCKNAYGKKEGDYIATEHALSKERLSGRVENIVSDSTFHNKQEMVANKTDLLRGELFDMHRLSPLTPSLQCSDQGKEAAKSRVLTGKYLPSPECDVTAFSPLAKFADSLENPERSLVILETNETVGTEYYDWQLDRNNMEIMDQPPLGCISVNNAGQLTPMSNASSMARAATLPSLREWTHLQQEAQQFQGSSSLVSGGSLSWRSSPITKLNEIKNLVCPESDTTHSGILEDETPEMLNEASTSIKSVKSSPPNQKRVSPPESHALELESSSSGGPRKFILNAMPSFPPLSPCIDSEGTSHENLGTGTSKGSD